MARDNLVDKYSYLIGQKINKWTVKDIVLYGKYNRPHAICECECGNVKHVWTANLINNHSKDCGCGRRSMLRSTRTKSLVGNKYGKLTAVELLDDSNKFNRRVYKCICDCGNVVTVPSSSLTTMHTLSCGCLTSYYNMLIRNVLEKKHTEFHAEYTVHIGDQYFRFDFYLPEYNLFIEYDGVQHYEPVRFMGNNADENMRIFGTIKLHDSIKNKYCEDNRINLLRIPYWEKENIETIIDDCLQRLNEKDLAS